MQSEEEQEEEESVIYWTFYELLNWLQYIRY